MQRERIVERSLVRAIMAIWCPRRGCCGHCCPDKIQSVPTASERLQRNNDERGRVRSHAIPLLPRLPRLWLSYGYLHPLPLDTFSCSRYCVQYRRGFGLGVNTVAAVIHDRRRPAASGRPHASCSTLYTPHRTSISSLLSQISPAKICLPSPKLLHSAIPHNVSRNFSKSHQQEPMRYILRRFTERIKAIRMILLGGSQCLMSELNTCDLQTPSIYLRLRSPIILYRDS